MAVKARDLRVLDEGGLQKKLNDLEKELMIEMTQLKSGGKAPNPKRVRSLKKSIAVVLTIINEKKLNIKRKVPEIKKEVPKKTEIKEEDKKDA